MLMSIDAFTISGIIFQLLFLFARPAHLVWTHRGHAGHGYRKFLALLILLRASWAIYAYWMIWEDMHNPDEWVLNSPGSVLLIYAALSPLLILVFDRILMYILGIVAGSICVIRWTKNL